MRRFFRYFYDYRGVCIWMCLSGAVFAVVFAMYGITLEAVWYPLLISGAPRCDHAGGRLCTQQEKTAQHGAGPVIRNAVFRDVTDILPGAGSLAEEDYQALDRENGKCLQGEKGESGTLPAGIWQIIMPPGCIRSKRPSRS